MGPLNKTWFSFKEAMVHENSMRQIDLVEMIQCLEESVMLVLSVIFDNRGLNVLPAAQKKKRQKHKRSGKTTRKAKCCFIQLGIQMPRERDSEDEKRIQRNLTP